MKFSHYYYKLHEKVFPTVRSVKYLEDHNLSIGDIDEIFINNISKGNAVVIAEQQYIISNMGLAFLKYDAESPKTHIETHQEYVDLLNSFIRFDSNRLGTTKSVLWMAWIKMKTLTKKESVKVLDEIIDFLGAQ